MAVEAVNVLSTFRYELEVSGSCATGPERANGSARLRSAFCAVSPRPRLLRLPCQFFVKAVRFLQHLAAIAVRSACGPRLLA